jgi:hypothetical protein
MRMEVGEAHVSRGLIAISPDAGFIQRGSREVDIIVRAGINPILLTRNRKTHRTAGRDSVRNPHCLITWKDGLANMDLLGVQIENRNLSGGRITVSTIWVWFTGDTVGSTI